MPDVFRSPPTDPHDLVAAVLHHAQRSPERTCVETFSRRAPQDRRSFAEVAEGAGRAAAFWAARGLRRGDVVLFLGTHHIDFYAAWLGCIWLGGVPSVLAEPTVRIDKQIYWARLGELLRRIEAWGVAADPRIKIEQQLATIPRLHRYDEIAGGSGPVPAPISPRPDETMLLQHSSGTTGLQKGVMLSHQAVRRHAESYNRPLEFSESDRIASWLPLYHDMGFIACFVNALWQGVPVVWLSPFEWVANPGLLLDAITRHRATLVWLPNFAFAFLASRVKPEPGRYDLSSLRALINCSEPVTAEAMQAFCDRFAADGFHPEALQTCYAMAETVFAVSTSDSRCRPRLRLIDRNTWQTEHRAATEKGTDPTLTIGAGTAAAGSSADVVAHVSNGRCVPDCEVKIVDDEGRPAPPCSAGRVLVRSPFLFSGYFRRDDLNANLFTGDGFFDTGDLGYVDEEGHVYITGRRKDLVIVGGKNIYPQDVEQAAAGVPGVHPGRIVCFGVAQRSLATEGLVLLLESDEAEAEWQQLAQRVRLAIPARLDVDLLDVRVVARSVLRKSTSGKLAREGNRRWYLEGRFGEVPPGIGSGE
jgi:acyl-CoA synthetase (AMP-forming)/AMP-acid ligase II